MNLLFWKHKTEKHVIKQNCLNKLPIAHHAYYEQTNDEPTHHYDNGTGLLTGILVGEMLSNNNNIPGGEFVGTNTPDQFEGFQGGDFGGGGNGGSYDSPSSDYSVGSDSSSSYDSSSSDSSSYDSGSSSSDF
jgi:hypothetical protein